MYRNRPLERQTTIPLIMITFVCHTLLSGGFPKSHSIHAPRLGRAWGTPMIWIDSNSKASKFPSSVCVYITGVLIFLTKSAGISAKLGPAGIPIAVFFWRSNKFPILRPLGGVAYAVTDLDGSVSGRKFIPHHTGQDTFITACHVTAPKTGIARPFVECLFGVAASWFVIRFCRAVDNFNFSHCSQNCACRLISSLVSRFD